MCSYYVFLAHGVTLKSGFDINGCPIAQGKWNASSGKWKRHPTCPIGQVKMILWYVQFLKSKMINIELFSVGSRGEFYLNIASYVSCILHHFVDYGIPSTSYCINIVFNFAGQWKASYLQCSNFRKLSLMCIAFVIKILKAW